MGGLFPITEYWSWSTFLLYIIVAFSVCNCCKSGAIWRVRESACNTSVSIIHVRNSSLYYFIAFSILVILGTIRSIDVGSDTRVYIGYFDNVGSFTFQLSKLFSFNQMEPGFQLYLSLIRSISSNYTFLFFINSLLVAFAYIEYIKYFFDEESDYTFLQIFIFYYVSNMSGMRAALATVFLLFSFIKLSQGKYMKAILLTLFACCFHYTMIYNFYIIAASYVFKSEGLRKKKWLWYFSLTIILGLALTSTSLLRGLFAGTKYSYYTENLEDQSLLGSLFFLLFGICAFGCYRLFIDSEFVKEKIKNIYVASIAFIITYPVIFVTGAYRIPNYYILPRLTIWGEMKKYYQSRIYQKQLFHIIIQILVVVYLLFRFTRSSVNGGFIYHTIF